MFSSGSFKNLVGTVDSLPQPNPNDSIYNETLEITIELAKDYAWAAMDETSKNASELSQLAPTGKKEALKKYHVILCKVKFKGRVICKLMPQLIFCLSFFDSETF